MTKLYSSLSVIALMAIGTTLHAQEDSTNAIEAPSETESTVAAETESQDTQAEAPSAEGATEADVTAEPETNVASAPAQEEAAQPAVYIAEQYGDWQLKCYKTDAEKDPCNLFQLLPDDSGNPVATIDLFKLPEGGQAVAGATVAVPLQTLLTQDLKIAVDGGRAKVYEFVYCDRSACYAQLGFTQEDINAFKAGNSAVMQIVPAQAPDRFVNIGVSLDGFTAAFKSEAITSN
ncbi:invasion associated locus B family protein [Roseovarius sp. EL26]|uniref:invasion associated locus B family protein n=1 Tax=Roseovarius sp. EL26 TaxID=2126672 RepID=UPI000EA265FB|nr:invasion associated locus B family protein [Roseovarius sp. EL26]